VVHVASPFPLDMKDEARIIKPAVEGTKSVLKACAHSKIKRVVITSSCVSIMWTKDKNKTVFTPKDWSDLDVCNAYDKSKTLAEKAAWEFADSKEAKGLEIVTINPGLIVGPNLVTS